MTCTFVYSSYLRLNIGERSRSRGTTRWSLRFIASILNWGVRGDTTGGETVISLLGVLWFFIPSTVKTFVFALISLTLFERFRRQVCYFRAYMHRYIQCNAHGRAVLYGPVSTCSLPRTSQSWHTQSTLMAHSWHTHGTHMAHCRKWARGKELR